MRTVTLSLLWVLVGACAAAFADPDDPTIWGEGRFERIKGRPGDYILLNEWELWLSPDNGVAQAPHFMLGMGAWPAGTYEFTEQQAPGWWYTIYVTRPWCWVAPKVARDVEVIDGQLDQRHVETNIDYSCYEEQSSTPSDSAWYQTFRATGTSINRIQWKLAGWNTSEVEVSIRMDNGGSITGWPQVGPAKRAGTGGGDAWVGFRSGEIPTTPHSLYAVKLRGVGGNFEVRCRNEDNNGYALGQAYDAGGNPHDVDLLVSVFSDNDGTLIPYQKMDAGKVEQTMYSAMEWGQTLTATGVALAAADLYYSGSNEYVGAFRIFAGEPGGGGPQIGPTKTCQAGWGGPGVGMFGISYAPGEVMLNPGSKYYIQMTATNGGAPTSFNAFAFYHNSENRYTGGTAWSGNGVDDPVAVDEDLQMTVIEYQPWYSPAVVNPSFEDYGGYLDGWRIVKFDGKGPDDPPHDNTNPYGPQTPFGDHFAGKITSWQGMDFSFGQIIEVGDYDPGATEVGWLLSAYVQLHCHSGAEQFPANVHQVWEIGWNNDDSVPPSVDRCDNYATIADIDGNYTGNDSHNFYPLSVNGTITGATGVKYVALRVRLYNDTAKEWSMSNIDNITFQVPPPGPQIELNPTTIERSVWIGDDLPNDSFTVANAGTDTINYTIEYETDDGGDWLSVWPLFGASSGEADPIEVSYDTADLPADVYTATITVTSPEAWNSPQTLPVTLTVETVSPDFDGDADVDQEDFGHFQACLTGPGAAQEDPECLDALLDEDEDVDSDDFDIFRGCLTGANLPADPQCAGTE